MKTIIHTEEFKIFADIPLFKGISHKHLLNIYSISQEVFLEKGNYLFHQDDQSIDFYIIKKGSVEIVKHDTLSPKEHQLSVLVTGDIVGEMGLQDREPRSASVIAREDTTLIKINYDALSNIAYSKIILKKLYHYIIHKNTQRLRSANETSVHALQQKIAEYKLRVQMGTFMVNVIGVLCLYTFSLAGLRYLTQEVSSSSFVTIPLMLLFVFAFCLVVKFSDLPLSSFGLTTKNWRLAIKDSIYYTIPFLICIIAWKWFELQAFTSYANRSLFEPTSFITASRTSIFQKWEVWYITIFFYCFFVSPLQELIARGGLQGSLENFLTSKHKTTIAIVLSNIIFATAHLYLSFVLACIVFFAGLFFGWLYARNRTLIGVCLSHILVGVWAFWIVGI